MSVMSEEGSSVVGGSVCGAGPDYYCGPDGDPTRDLLARSPDPPLQPSPETPPHAQVQLRYLLQVFLEAGCLEWSAVVSVVLRDALAVVRVVTAAKDAPLPALSRLLHGLTALTLFTHTHCLGYQSFMAAISPQMRVLETLIKSRGESCPPPSSPTAPHSVPKSGPIPSNQRTASGVVDAVGLATVLSQHDSSGMNAASASLPGPLSIPLGPGAGNSLLPSPTDGNPPPPPPAHYSLPKSAASGRLNSKVDRAGSHSQDDSSEGSRSVRNSTEEVPNEPGACSLQ